MDPNPKSAIDNMSVRDNQPVGTNDKTGAKGSTGSWIFRAADTPRQQSPDESADVVGIVRRRPFGSALTRADLFLFDNHCDNARRNSANKIRVAADFSAAGARCEWYKQRRDEWGGKAAAVHESRVLLQYCIMAVSRVGMNYASTTN
jgi:hypothetical protein